MRLHNTFLLFIFTLVIAVAVTLNLYSVSYLPTLSDHTQIFATLASISYAFVFFSPLLLVYFLIKRLASSLAQAAIAIMVTSLILLVLLGDLYIFSIYGFHINGFVLNILLTPGGIESLGGESSTFISGAVVTLSCFIVVSLLWLLASRFSGTVKPHWSKKLKFSLICLFLLSTVSEKIIYGFAILDNDHSILTTAEHYPLYTRTSFRKFAKSLGYSAVQRQNLNIELETSQLNYPLKEISYRPTEQLPNIIWLVGESWRWDMLDARIAPKTWKFAQKSISFQNHYSSGNGTRMGMFGMFYGLPGSYWFKFLNERRSPVLVDALQRLNYQTEFFTSAKFSYPEFDKTILARIAPEHLHSEAKGKGWQRDKTNVTQLIESIDNRDRSRPFMRFMFFESSHANYYFPPESIIEPDFLQDFDYISTNISEDINLIKNRYINACHHLDSQFGRITDYLAAQDLLENTIVIITGDHGEEFMEAGRWGHNSQFSNPQIRTPLVMHIPGRPSNKYKGMSSHMDIPAILLNELGVNNDPRDYSDSVALLEGEQRKQSIVASWSTIGYIDKDYKITLPTSTTGMLEQNAWHTSTDAPIDIADVYSKKLTEISKLVSSLHRFQY